MNVTEFINKLIKDAIDKGASDIHLEPGKDDLRVRLRMDGLLFEHARAKKEHHLQAAARTKIMANMDIAEQRLPQDGKVHLRLGEKEYDLRVSTIPTIHGEKIVMRILKKSMALISVGELGMSPEDLLVYNSQLNRTSGMIIVTGPTGCGKTTTLYATLNKLNSQEKNIITIEDPVEYELPGINQMNTNPKSGLTFGKALRSILRQDPDIIMVGEIRDEETARIAVQAAMTGHLVLSTMHTTDSVGAIFRLLDLGIEPFLVNASLSAVIAQRLLRLTAGGRTGIFEILKLSTGLKELIANGATENKIRSEAIRAGMRTLLGAGGELVRAGLTTIQDVLRVCHQD